MQWKFWQPKKDVEPSEEMIEVATEIAEKKLRDHMADFIDLASLFAEDNGGTFIKDYGALVMTVIIFVFLLIKLR